MKSTLTLAIVFLSVSLFAQTYDYSSNKHQIFNDYKNESVNVSGNVLSIKTRVIFNAVPDGYHVTYTFTSISNTVEELEAITQKKIHKLESDLKKEKFKNNHVILDIVSLDPVFDFKTDTSSHPSPNFYKSTYNLSFTIDDIGQMDQLSRVCLNYDIYDLVDINPFINNVDFIEDSLINKSVEVLNKKKAFAEKLGFSINDGKPSFNKKKTTIYPSERHLKEFIRNRSLYQHNFSQNSTIGYNRQVDIDNYYNIDLHKSDYIFNAKEGKPVIQFVYDISYNYVKRDREAEALAKELREEERKQKKDIYILDKNGRVRKATF